MEYFKTLEDLREYLKKFDQYFARPVPHGEHPTLYLNPQSTNKEVVCGIQRDDYLFSPCSGWILPSDAHGLSFSGHWQHLRGIARMKAKRNPGKSIAVYWVLEKADMPSGLKIQLDPRDKKKQHYLLCVTEKMTTHQLRAKLEWIADRMSVIRAAQGAL